MKTKFNIGDKVYITATVQEIRVNREGKTIYTLDLPNDKYIYVREEKLKGVEDNG